MKILIIGATGFIGRELVRTLPGRGHMVLAVTRNKSKARKLLGDSIDIAEWDGLTALSLASLLPGIDAVINLAGENIGSGRWTRARKKKLTDSRVATGRLIAEAIKIAPSGPAVLIQGSAVGFYGPNAAGPADETFPAGTGFSAELTVEWENSIRDLEPLVPRIIWLRTSPVLGKNGGLLERLMLPFRFYAGTILGSGQQWMSWIHINDQVGAIGFLLENKNSQGVYNLAAPGSVTMKSFIKTISKVTGIPAWLRIPGWALKAALGEMARETVLASINAYPSKLLKEGYVFKFPDLEPALRNLLNDTK